MNPLINYILQYGDLNAQQIALIEKKVKAVRLSKDQYFSEAGRIGKEIGFVVEGILRVCYYKKNGDEVTRYFIDEDHWVVDINSFNLKIPSVEYIQAVTDCSVLVLTRERLEDLSNTIVQWDMIMAKMTNKALLEKVQRISPMIAEDAKTRYLEFLNRFPKMANRIPLHYLASYIGITKSSLSRIRREIGNDGS